MADYTYKEDLLRKVNDIIKNAPGEQVSFSADGLKSLIESLPFVDAVEVVRCKDCKYRDRFNRCERILISSNNEFKKNYSSMVEDDFFCGEGKRKKVEKEIEEDSGVIK